MQQATIRGAQTLNECALPPQQHTANRSRGDTLASITRDPADDPAFGRSPPDLVKEPKPFIRQKSLADYAVNHELNASYDKASRVVALYTERHRNIQDVFNEYGVQIMTPSYRADTPQPKIVPKARWYTSPAVEVK